MDELDELELEAMAADNLFDEDCGDREIEESGGCEIGTHHHHGSTSPGCSGCLMTILTGFLFIAAGLSFMIMVI